MSQVRQEEPAQRPARERGRPHSLPAAGGSRQDLSWCGLIPTVLELAKVRLTAMIALSSAMGYLLAVGRLDWGILGPLIGTFLLAGGSAAWNQCQDAAIDARMDRTRGRPIPSGRICRFPAALVGAILVLLGLYVLSRPSPTAGNTLALGLLAVLWYNVVYTPLKRRTAFAVVPGALLGALGPMIGFSAGGGDPLDPCILTVGAFFWVWQIPHFWLLVLRFGQEQAAAGLPSPMRLFARPQLARITLVWVCAAAAMGPVLLAGQWPLQSRHFAGGDPIRWPWAHLLLAGSAWLALSSLRLLGREESSTVFKRLFARVNAYGCLVMLCLTGSAMTAGT